MMSSESKMDAGGEAMVMLLDPANSQPELIQTEQAATQENVSIPDMYKPFPKLAGNETTSALEDTDFIQYVQKRDNQEVMLDRAEGQEAGRIKGVLDVMAGMHLLGKDSSNRERMYLDVTQAGATIHDGQEAQFYDFNGQQKRPHSPDDN